MIPLGKDDFKEWVKINSMFVAWNIRLFNYLIIIQTIIATLQKVAKIGYPKIRFCQCYDIFCVRLTKVHWVDVICHTGSWCWCFWFLNIFECLCFFRKHVELTDFGSTEWGWQRFPGAREGRGRRGKVEKGESQEVEGGEILGSKVCKGLLHVFSKEWKQHFVTIVTVTIYLTQVYIHFHLCNLCHPFTIVALGE